MNEKSTQKLAAVWGIITGVALIILVSSSLSNKLLFPTTTKDVQLLTDFTCLTDLGTTPLTLPTKLTHLPPRSPVTLYAEIDIKPLDSLMIKSLFAPLRLYVDDILVFECGQEGQYPSYMNDPPAILSTVSLPHAVGKHQLRLEYLSLTQRQELILPSVLIGNESALWINQFYTDGFSLLFSLLLILMGVAMPLISSILSHKIPGRSVFLWLGFFSLSAGIFVFGECDLAILLLPYPVLLYNMSFMGLFLAAIPFLHFGMVVLNPKSKLPFIAMLWVNYLSVTIAILLSLTGIMDFTKSLYWFHVISPLSFAVFIACLLWEYFRYQNDATKKFAPATTCLVIFLLLEVLNYWLPVTHRTTLFFQLGILTFVLSLAIASGYYVKDATKNMAQRIQLEYELGAMGRQLDMQRLQYQRLKENTEAEKFARHDLRHQLAVLKGYSANGHLDILDQYLDKLIGNIPFTETTYCENYAVNTVMNHHLSSSSSQNIQLDIRLDIPEHTGLVPTTDLCVIMGNLLENAVEACCRMEQGERFIRARSRLQGGYLSVSIENSFDGVWNEKNGVCYSRKRSGALEGVGLSSVKAVCVKYGGLAKIEVNGNVWRSTALVDLGEMIAKT